jgi:predicted AAA+ superfamily ATPase
MMTDSFGAKQRVDQALEALRVGLAPYVAEKMKQRHGNNWRQFASRAAGGDMKAELDTYALLKTVLDNYADVFRHDARLRKARSYISLALDARNSSSHFDGLMQDREALRYLDAVREMLDAIGAKPQVKIVEGLYEKQKAVNPSAEKQKTIEEERLEEPPTPAKLQPWREVAQPHPDVLEARFTDAEFAANLAHVDQGLGSEEYIDPLAFFRITYLTEGLSRVLRSAIERFGKTGGDPVIGLQTNFGGGKTHTMLALYHLAGARKANYAPETLHGMKSIFEAARTKTLPEVKRAVFVGTHKGPSEVMHASDGREVRTAWGYIAYRLGGWSAVDLIADSEAKRTNPGSEKLVQILQNASPCLILLDEVVAFAKQLRDEEYESFHAFIQSLTEAAASVPGAMLVGSLPESDMEVGDQRGVDALRRFEKLFGRVQSAWTPASGMETFEIVRRRLFQPLDEDGEKARDATIQAFSKMYRDNASDFPPEAREPAYREEMRRAYPIHPEVLKRFSEDWSTLEKFQRTRGILKIMANVIYAMWRGQSTAPLITLALLPLSEEKVRTAILEPLDRLYGPILQAEVDGDLSLPTRMEASRKRMGDVIAATRAARAVFLATAPHLGSARGGLTGPALRLACAQPGDQISIFGDALRELSERAAYLYREGDSYWFSTQPTLNRIADERAKDVSSEDADAEITAILRKEQVTRGGFHRVHGAPDSPVDVDDARAIALVILSPSYVHAGRSEEPSVAQAIVRDTLQRRGSGQRRFRNSLIFVAGDESGLDSCREIARKFIAWRSIVNDQEMSNNLTRSQHDDARSRMQQSAEGLAQRVRSTWSHVLYPMQTGDGGNGSGSAAGFDLEHTGVVNRAPGKPIPQIVYEKLKASGVIVDELGPDTLMAELGKVWDEKLPHIEIATLLDWFASYVYLPRLRDDATLVASIEKLVAKIEHPVAFAQSFDKATGKYQGISRWGVGLGAKIATGLLVRPSALPAQAPDEKVVGDNSELSAGRRAGDSAQPATGDSIKRLPRRFVGSITLDPDRAGLQVAKIAEEILFELTRSNSSTLKLTLEIEASAATGYPDDVVDVVRSNIRDLKLDASKVGFEEE